MSHKATVWAIQQRGLKPATKIVLWFLCDRHNPDFGCFPTQARLADDAEMSVSALNDHLAKLEQLGLIHRVRTHDPRTHKRQATRYILGFEGFDTPFHKSRTPETGDGTQIGVRSQNKPTTQAPETRGHGAISRISKQDPRKAISGFWRCPSPESGD